MLDFEAIHKEILSKQRTIDSLIDDKVEFFAFAESALNRKVNRKALFAFLQLCLDYYALSTSGNNLIPDIMYDKVMEVYKSIGGSTIVYVDSILQDTKWNFIAHKIPGMVGTIKKVYEYDAFKVYLNVYNNISMFKLSVKFDGVSICIEKRDGRMISAATRYDGEKGQDVTALIKGAVKYQDFLNNSPDGFYKCEVLVTTSQFNELIQYKRYANRRSATSGIIGTPSNIKYAKYLTVVPLLYYDDYHHEKHYIAPFTRTVTNYSPRDIMDEIEKMMEEYRSSKFEFRMDGIVITPVMTEVVNEGNLMENSIAFKVNTNEAKTRIQFAYMSVGRLGKAVPMARVDPVEVNETVVTDPSFGSYPKFKSMELRENEEVIVYSAGDVIPQIKLPLIRTNYHNMDDLKIDKHCPYCGEKFTKDGADYYCRNNQCIRIATGKIANFMDKLGVEGFSDQSFITLYENNVIKNIPDIFSINQEDIEKAPGFDTTSATKLMHQIQRLKQDSFNVSDVFGALGIEGISTKKCRKIFSVISLDRLIELITKKKFNKIHDNILGTDGIGVATANTFVRFLEDEVNLIQFICNRMHILGDIQWRGNIVFTGFRNSQWSDKFQSIGYEVSNTVNRNTICVIAASMANNTGNMITATDKGIPVYQYSDIDKIYDNLKYAR